MPAFKLPPGVSGLSAADLPGVGPLALGQVVRGFIPATKLPAALEQVIAQGRKMGGMAGEALEQWMRRHPTLAGHFGEVRSVNLPRGLRGQVSYGTDPEQLFSQVQRLREGAYKGPWDNPFRMDLSPNLLSRAEDLLPTVRHEGEHIRQYLDEPDLMQAAHKIAKRYGSYYGVPSEIAARVAENPDLPFLPRAVTSILDARMLEPTRGAVLLNESLPALKQHAPRWAGTAWDTMEEAARATISSPEQYRDVMQQVLRGRY